MAEHLCMHIISHVTKASWCMILKLIKVKKKKCNYQPKLTTLLWVLFCKLKKENALMVNKKVQSISAHRQGKVNPCPLFNMCSGSLASHINIHPKALDPARCSWHIQNLNTSLMRMQPAQRNIFQSENYVQANHQ